MNDVIAHYLDSMLTLNQYFMVSQLPWQPFCPSRVLEIFSGWQRGKQQAELYAHRAVAKDQKTWRWKWDRTGNNTWDGGGQVI